MNESVGESVTERERVKNSAQKPYKLRKIIREYCCYDNAVIVLITC